MSQLPIQNSYVDQQMNLKHHDKTVGFDARNKDSLAHTYTCQICKFLLRDPVQLRCGHRFCRSCINTEEHPVIKCIICNVETSQEKVIIDRGCRQDMKTLQILCSLCEWNGIFENYPEHISTCHASLLCEYCSKTFVSMDILIQHQSECDKMIVNCRLKPYGCTEQFLRMNTQNHLLTEKHQSVMLNILFQTTPHSMNNKGDQQLTSSEMDLDPTRSVTSTSAAAKDRLYETVDVLVSSIQVLNDDTQRHSSETVSAQCSLQSLSEGFLKLKIAIQETNTSIESLKPNQQVLLQDLDTLKQDVEYQQATSYDGTLIWRITDVQKKMADAQSEKQISIYSPPFYSSPNGYKMCARLYLHGDGDARRTHMSLFFVLMRGEHDAILQFPFTYKVTFCLYDQTSQQRHIIDSFRPDAKSNSFERPRLEMNTASGIPKFFPLAMIQQYNNPYVRNDTMFIKIMVHFDETPKTLLPYILNLNPGLSAPIQQIMIKHETEKRAQQQPIVTNASTLPVTTDVSK